MKYTQSQNTSIITIHWLWNW